MKRLILAAILIFPVITLVMWFYWGAQNRISSNLPVATNWNNGTNAPTNVPPPAKP